MRRHAMRAAFVLLALVFAAGLHEVYSAWSFRRELEQAERELTTGRTASARQRLSRLASRWPGRSEILLPLGNTEESEGRIDAAIAAWRGVSSDSPLYEQAAIRLAQAETDRGRHAVAEAVLVTALDRPGTRVVEVRQLLLQLFWHEGRLDEARRLIEKNWFTLRDTSGADSPVALATLRGHLSIDFDAYPVDQIHALLAAAAQKSPDDDRVALGVANMALRAGRLDDAAERLATCARLRPDDPAVWQARLELALAQGDLLAVKAAIPHLSPAVSPDDQAPRLLAWFASERGDAPAERAALEAWLASSPAHPATLERLAELSAQAGELDRAVQLRRRKAEIDRSLRIYRNMVTADFKANAPEMARLAESIGRRFEARGFATLLVTLHPEDREALATVARLDHEEAKAVQLRPSLDTLRAAVETHDPPRSGPAGQFVERLPDFADIADQVGLRFTFDHGRSPLRQLPETMSGGVGVLDFDGDGWLDVYAVQGGPFPPDPSSPGGDRLFRNRGDGTFDDASERSGIARLSGGYGHGVAIGDYDNDGRPDVFVTRWRAYALYRNKGDGTFEDATLGAGLGGDRDWPTSAAFADLDGDGDLDLYVGHYLAWDASNPRACRNTKGAYSYCDPRLFDSLPDHVFRNDAGRFVDVTREAGFTDPDGRGLGVLAADLDGDGRVEVFVANDGTANFLFRNLGGFRFEEVGLASGVSGNAEGGFQAGMGVACGDLDGDGRPDLAVTNFYGESTSLYQNLGGLMFADRTTAVGLRAATRGLLGFGTAFVDVNNDGLLDLATTNGHVNDARPFFPYAMPAQLLLGTPGGRLIDVSQRAGAPWREPRIGRGLAAGDFDNDGRVDFVILGQGEPLALLRNTTARPGRSLTLSLEGTRSNRDAVGSIVKVKAGGRTFVSQRFGGGSYQSSSDPRLHFGLGTAEQVEWVEVRWPSGRVDRFTDVNTSPGYRLTEGGTTPRPLPGFAKGKP